MTNMTVGKNAVLSPSIMISRMSLDLFILFIHVFKMLVLQILCIFSLNLKLKKPCNLTKLVSYSVEFEDHILNYKLFLSPPPPPFLTKTTII